MTTYKTRLAALALAALAGSFLGPATASAEEIPANDLTIGVSLPSYHYSLPDVSNWEAVAGHHADVVQTFVSWEYPGQPTMSAFPHQRALGFTARGSQLEITWVPSSSGGPVNQPRFSLASIASGAHDAYITKFATDVKRFGAPLRLRFGHEMNGNWASYSELRSGNRPGDFAAAWRHVHDVFAAVGATNVSWVWSPNILHPGGIPLAGLYPGDDYVDLVGIDGYSYPKAGCLAADRLFNPTLASIRTFTQRPVVLAEVGVSVNCTNRALFIDGLFQWLKTTPGLQGMTWWERAGADYDYRALTSPITTTALSAQLAALD